MKIVTTLVNAIGTKFEAAKINRAQLLPYPYPCMRTNERENETLQTDSECTKSTQSIAATLALQCSACTCSRAGRHHGTYKSTFVINGTQHPPQAAAQCCENKTRRFMLRVDVSREEIRSEKDTEATPGKGANATRAPVS